MARVVERLAGWARSSWSVFAELRGSTFEETAPTAGTEEPIYRLREWPRLPAALRTADVLRLLSLMSNRPVNRSWMLRHSPLKPDRIERLLRTLTEQGALDIIDPTCFPAQVPVAP
jgi:hypothetical protein